MNFGLCTISELCFALSAVCSGLYHNVDPRKTIINSSDCSLVRVTQSSNLKPSRIAVEKAICICSLSSYYRCRSTTYFKNWLHKSKLMWDFVTHVAQACSVSDCYFARDTLDSTLKNFRLDAVVKWCSLWKNALFAGTSERSMRLTVHQLRSLVVIRQLQIFAHSLLFLDSYGPKH